MQKETIEKFKKVKVLDCSIRDGGHLNKWRFDFDFVKKAYSAISQTGIHFIEIGYRTTPDEMEDTGLWRHTPDELINSLIPEKSNVKIVLMGDIGKIKKEDFLPKSKSPIDVVRLAFYQPDIDEAIDIANDLVEKGYVVSLNLMGITKYTEEQIKEAIIKLRATSVDMVYLADSFGSLFPHEISNIIKIFKQGTGKAIGFHPHNNLQLAFANTIAAIEAGAEYIDCSINGIGRGAGNLPLETILLFLNKYNNERYNLIPALDFIEKDLKIIKYDIEWGYNIPYVLSAINNCHPSFSLSLMNKSFQMKDIFSVLSTLSNMNNTSFNKEILEKAIDKTTILDKTSELPHDLSKITLTPSLTPPEYLNKHQGKDFLIIANGPSLNEYEEKIRAFIEKTNPVIIGSNFLGKKFTPNYHVFNDFERFKQYVSTVNPQSQILVGSYLAEHLKKLNLSINFNTIKYISSQNFRIENGIIYSSPSTVVILMISLAIAMGANNIYVVGMDGYKIQKTHFYDEKGIARLDTTSTLQKKMEQDLKLIHNYLTTNNQQSFKIITPTSFNEYYNGELL